MKKLLVILLVALLTFACFANGAQENSATFSPVETALKEAEGLTWDELLAKAKEEIGDNELQVYAVSSRLDTDAFTKVTGIKTKTTVLAAADLYTKFSTEAENDVYGADVVSALDAYEMNNIVEEGYVKNFVPDEYKTLVSAEEQNPLNIQYVNFVFFYNNDHGKLKNYLWNMWQMADPEYKGILMQNPLTAGINWVIEMTKPEWETKIRAAYKSYYGKEWQPSEKFEYAAYEWFYGLLQNAQFEAKGGTIYNNTINGRPGTIGIVAFSKWREGDISTLGIAPVEGIEGIGGYIQPTFFQVASNARYPYAAALFVDYLLSVEGYEAYYGKDPGGYSNNPQVAISEKARSRGDRGIDLWKQFCPGEDTAYIGAKYSDAFTKISQWVAEKR